MWLSDLSVILVPFLQPKFGEFELETFETPQALLRCVRFANSANPTHCVDWVQCHCSRTESMCHILSRQVRDEGTKRNDQSEIKNNGKKQRWGYIMIYIYHICIYTCIYIYINIHNYIYIYIMHQDNPMMPPWCILNENRIRYQQNDLARGQTVCPQSWRFLSGWISLVALVSSSSPTNLR